MKKLALLFLLSFTLFSCQKETLIYTEKENIDMKNIQTENERLTEFAASNSNETACEAWSDSVDQLIKHDGDNDYPVVGDFIFDLYSGNPEPAGWYKMGNNKVMKVILTKAGSMVDQIQTTNPC